MHQATNDTDVKKIAIRAQKNEHIWKRLPSYSIFVMASLSTYAITHVLDSDPVCQKSYSYEAIDIEVSLIACLKACPVLTSAYHE